MTLLLNGLVIDRAIFKTVLESQCCEEHCYTP